MWSTNSFLVLILFSKEWVRPYLISLSLTTLRDILDANKPIDCDCFSMSVRTVVCNEPLLSLEDKFQYMKSLLLRPTISHFLSSSVAHNSRSVWVLQWPQRKRRAKPSQMFGIYLAEHVFFHMDSFMSRHQGVYQDKRQEFWPKQRSRCLKEGHQKILYKDVLAWWCGK